LAAVVLLSRLIEMTGLSLKAPKPGAAVSLLMIHLNSNSGTASVC